MEIYDENNSLPLEHCSKVVEVRELSHNNQVVLKCHGLKFICILEKNDQGDVFRRMKNTDLPLPKQHRVKKIVPV